MTTSFTPSLDKNTAATLANYRADIDGLRALAVMAVVGFHAFPDWFRGGFVGVDVFFVVSGYLISTILFTALAAGNFSFKQFYIRRIVRIFPALITILIFCCVFGWFTLFAEEYKQLGKHIAGGAGFLSNFLYWQEAGYFDSAADAKPLLHLWSLGIEEQFYIAWPILLYGGWKFKSWPSPKRSKAPWLLLGLTVLSLVFSIIEVKEDVVAAFYSPLLRAWELIAGGLLAYAVVSRQSIIAKQGAVPPTEAIAPSLSSVSKTRSAAAQNFQSLVGIVLILYAVFAIDKSSPFPGALALLPVVGTVLLISADQSAWFNRNVLSNRVLVWIGLISFPLYLWHWPLLSFARILEGSTPKIGIRVAVVCISVLLAWFTFSFIEKPMRYGADKQRKAFILCFLMTLVAGAGYYLYDQKGILDRSFLAQNTHEFETPETFANWDGLFQKDCSFTQPGPNKDFNFPCMTDTRSVVTNVLIGDSKAIALYPSLARNSTKERWMRIVSFPVMTTSKIYSDNRFFEPGATEALVEWLANTDDIKVVVITTAARSLFKLGPFGGITLADLPKSPNYQVAFDGLNPTIKQLIAKGKRVVITVDNPTLLDPLACVQRKVNMPFLQEIFSKNRNAACSINLEVHLNYQAQYRRLIDNLKLDNPQLVVYDPTHLLCNFEKKECSFEQNGQFMYSYFDHLSTYSADLVAKELVLLVDELTKP